MLYVPVSVRLSVTTVFCQHDWTCSLPSSKQRCMIVSGLYILTPKI